MSIGIGGCKLLVNERKCLVGAKDFTESFLEDMKSELPQLFMDAEEDLDWDGVPDAREHHNKGLRRSNDARRKCDEDNVASDDDDSNAEHMHGRLGG